MKKQVLPFFLTFFITAWGMSCFAQEYDFSGYKPDPGEHDRYVVYHIKPCDMKKPTYHKSVFFIASLLSKNRGIIPGSNGYYMNRSKFSPDGLRLTIFLKDGDAGKAASAWVEDLARGKIIKIAPYILTLPEESAMTTHYEGNERSFRKYLSLYTPIAIECMEHDFKRTQNEFQSLADHGGMDIELLESSSFFMSLNYDERSEFIRDLYFSRKWMHMAINFVLGHDDG